MERERNATDPDDLAEVSRFADQPRADNVLGWLGEIFDRRRQRKAASAATSHQDGNPALR
jgi:hypothetical protein